MKQLLMSCSQPAVDSTPRQHRAKSAGLACCLGLLFSLDPLVAATNYLRIERGTNQGVVVRAGAFDSRPYLIQAGTNVAGTNWVTIAAITNTENELVVRQFPAPDESNQFFKIAELPGLRSPTRQFAFDPGYPVRLALGDALPAGSHQAQMVTITSLPAGGELRDLVSVGLTNSDFLSRSNGWTTWVASGQADFDFQATGHYTTGGPDLRIQLASGGGVAGVYQELSLTPGRRYRLATRFTDYTNTASAGIWLGPTPPLQGVDYGPNTPGAQLVQTIPLTSSPLGREFVASTNQLYLVVQMFSSGEASGYFDYIRSFEIRPIASVPYTVLNDLGEVEYTGNSSDRESYRFNYTLTRVTDGLTSSPGKAETSDELSFNLSPGKFQGTEDQDLFFQIPDPRFPAAASGESVLLARPLSGQLFQVQNDRATLGPAITRIGERIWNPEGWLCYRPNSNGFATNFDSLSFATIFANDLFADESWVWIDVAPVPDPPVAAPSWGYVVNRQSHFELTAYSADKSPLHIVFVNYPTNGQIYPENTYCSYNCYGIPLSPSNAVPWGMKYFSYLPNDVLNTNRSFWSNFIDHASYYVENEAGLRSEEMVLTLECLTAYLDFWPVPLSTSVYSSTTNFELIPVFLKGHDPDGDDDVLNSVIITSPTNGVLLHPAYWYHPIPDFRIILAPGRLIYPDYGAPMFAYQSTNLAAAEDTFVYSIVDAGHGESPYQVTQHVHIVHVPFARDQTITNNWNSTIPITLDVFDPDGLPFSYEIINEPTNGVLMGSPNAGPLQVFYQPRSNYFGIDSFTFRGVRSDGTTGNVATASVRTIINVPDGLIHRWRFDANTVDVVSNYNGKIQGQAQFVTGKVGSKALRFDGVDDYLDIGRTNLPPPWTLTMWVKREDSLDPSAALFMDDRYALKLEQFGVTNRAVGFTEFGAADYAFNYTAPTNAWIQLSFVGTLSETRLYVNGGLIDSIPVSIPVPRDQLGRTPNDRLKGDLDDIQIFERELSPMEILGIYFTTR